MTVRIVADSTCDLPAEIIARYIISVVPLYINVGNQSFLDGIDMKRDEFYTRLPSFSTCPTTALPPLQKFHDIYQALADEGASEILSIHISAALSGTVDVARSAAQETTAVPVTVFDSQQLSLGTGFLVETAAKMATAGSSVSEILDTLTIRANAVMYLLPWIRWNSLTQRADEQIHGRHRHMVANQTDHDHAQR